MIAEVLKCQLLAWGMLSNEASALSIVVSSLLAFNMIEKIPMISLHSLFSNKKPVIKEEDQDKDLKKSSIEFHYYAHKEDILIESILEYICKQDQTKFLRYSNNYKPSNKETFSLNYKDIQCQIKTMEYTTDGKVSSFIFEIFSPTINLEELHHWIDKIKTLYEINKKNQLGNKKYYFKEFPNPPLTDNTGNYIWTSAASKLKFTMTEFSTNKNLSNVFGENIDEIKKRIDLFMNHPEWYAEKGIPRTLGLLFHGIPGTGKTSTIKAIAKSTNKHIIQVSLAKYTTQNQLNNLFFSETIEVHSEGQSHFYKIPLNQRLYVFEDIDCLSEIVQSRTNTVDYNPISQQQPLLDSMGSPIIPLSRNHHQQDSESIAINLNYLLNLLDGILETPERLLVMTTNHTHKLDSALIRPGRIDLDVEFTRLSSKDLKTMFDFFYSTHDTTTYWFDDSFNKALTPAEVTQILGTFYNDPNLAYERLVHDAKQFKKEEEKEEPNEDSNLTVPIIRQDYDH